MNSPTGFTTSAPLVHASHRYSSSSRHTRKGRRRPVRSCAPSSSPEDDSTPRDGLERLFRLDMVPTKGRRAECECIWCQGSKQARCTWCSGRGYREETKQMTMEELHENIENIKKTGLTPEKMPTVRVTCSACHGSKKLRCRYCLGSGFGSYGFAH